MTLYLAQIAIFIAISLTLAASLNLSLGFGGIFCIMQAAFYGAGAYAAAILVVKAHVPFPLELLGAGVAGALLAGVVALLILRLAAELVVIGTLALQLIISAVFTNWNDVTGGSYGIFGITRPTILGVAVTSIPGYLALSVAVAALCFGAALWIGHAPFGLALRAQREDAVLAAALGHDPVAEKRLVFIISGAMAGIAGGLYAEFVGYIDPTSFDITESLAIMTVTVIGGLANLWGTLGAAIVLTLLPQLLTLWPAASDVAAQIQLLLNGLLLVVIVRFWPHGLIPERAAIRAAGLPRPEGGTHGGLQDLAAIAIPALHGSVPAIQVAGISKRFGGLQAVDDVSFTLAPGRVTALIGPNGAGKTTLFNVLCGLLPADAGSVAFGGQDVTGRRAFAIARLGVTRTFQDVRIFPRLTALENVVFAMHRADAREALGHLGAVGLAADADQQAGSLSYAQQKLLMVAVILARQDPIVFLDEIAAGLDHASVRLLAGFIRRLAATGRLVCLVEHNLAFVWEAADEVFVMDQGRLIAAGPPAAIQSDPHIAEIYFGAAHVLADP
jgi:branched-chain amino acid transport system permease protein